MEARFKTLTLTVAEKEGRELMLLPADGNSNHRLFKGAKNLAMTLCLQLLPARCAKRTTTTSMTLTSRSSIRSATSRRPSRPSHRRPAVSRRRRRSSRTTIARPSLSSHTSAHASWAWAIRAAAAVAVAEPLFAACARQRLAAGGGRWQTSWEMRMLSMTS